MPEFDDCCEALGIPQSKADPAPAEHISKTSKQPKQPKQPKSAKQKRKPRYDKESNTWNKTRATPIEQAGLDHQDHDLLIAMPARHADPSTYDNDMKIQIITPGGPLSYTFTTDCPQMLSLDLRFPSTLARDIASYRLKTNYVTVDEGPCFELNVKYPGFSQQHRIVWILEVNSPELSNLLEILNLFLPHHQHVPVYVLHHGSSGNRPKGALRLKLPVFPDAHWELREEMAAAERAPGIDDWYLTATCSDRCKLLPHTMEAAEARDSRLGLWGRHLLLANLKAETDRVQGSCGPRVSPTQDIHAEK